MGVLRRSWLAVVVLLAVSNPSASQEEVEKGLGANPSGLEDQEDDSGSGVEGRSPVAAPEPSSCEEDTCNGNGKCTVKRYANTRVAVCTCVDGVGGKYCDEPSKRSFHLCVPNPCRNGGSCRLDKFSSTGFTCTCVGGFTGTVCLERPGCSCKPGEICQVVGGQHLCSPGAPHSCVPSPCLNGGTCRVKPGGVGYQCTCLPGYPGTNCEPISGSCNTATCIRGVCTSPNYCQCNAGWQGTRCDALATRVSCTPNPCFNYGQCYIDSFGQPRCRCPPNYSGSRCEQRTGTVNPCLPRSPCRNGGICNPLGSPICRCVGDFSGTFCETPAANPCFPNPCQNGAQCSINGQSFVCNCPPGTTGRTCNGRSLDPCHTNPCHGHGRCVSMGGSSFGCRCFSGYTGPYCTQILDPCRSGPCANGGVCSSSGQTYSCQCTPGYGGHVCAEPDCSNVYCYNRGRCQISGSKAICVCASGFGGVDCRTARSLPCDTSPCRNNGVCHNQGLDFACACVHGFTGKRCEQPPVNPCIPNPCQNGGHCSASSRGLDFVCACIHGFSGKRCERPPTNLCIPNPCQNAGHCSASSHGGVSCGCVNGYSGTYCQIPPVRDPCSTNPCRNGGRCTSHAGTAHCSCVNGFSGPLCTIQPPRPDPCTLNPCRNGGTCVPSGNSFICYCTAGFTGPSCAIPQPRPEPDPCRVNPCLNGGTCSPSGSNFICSCPLGWTGRLCSVLKRSTDTPCNPNPCLGGCNCVESCRHANGYYCRGTTGLLGKNCQLPAPIVTCGPNAITISVDAAVMNEYDSGIGGFVMFMAPTSSMAPTPTCPARNLGSSFSLVLPLPFNACGSTIQTTGDGKTTVTNTVWLNRLIANGVADMPVPIVQFICSYDKQYSVITSLKPGISVPPTVVSRGARTDAANIELCKSGQSCPARCPAVYSLSQGATYTVGEELHLRLTLTNLANQFRISDLFLSCNADPSSTWTTAPIVLLAGGCLATGTGKYLPVKVRSTAAGTCASFPVPIMKACTDFFIHAKLQPCSSSACLAAYVPCSGRRKRSEEEPEEDQTVKVIGPIVVIKGGDGAATFSLYPGKDRVNDTGAGVLVLKEDLEPTNRTIKSTLLPLQVALGVLLLLAVALFCLLVFYNWHCINAHCGRKV